MWLNHLVPEFRYRVEFRGLQSWDIECPYEEPTLLLISFLTLPKGLQVDKNVLHLEMFSACLIWVRPKWMFEARSSNRTSIAQQYAVIKLVSFPMP
jgi:hypothetical protein